MSTRSVVLRVLLLLCCTSFLCGEPTCEHSRSEAYATLLTTKDFLPGVVVLARILTSLDKVRPVLVLVLESLLTAAGGRKLREHLEAEGLHVIPVPRVGRPAGPGSLQYPQYSTTYTKLHIFNLTGYSTIVYLDADTMPLESLEDLFRRNVSVFAAAPDIMLPDNFNSGVMVVRPSQMITTQLFEFAATATPYDGGDQGLLNEFFNSNGEWYAASSSERLPIGCNLPVVVSKLHPVSWTRALRNAKIIHFSGGAGRRPWNMQGAVSPTLAAAVTVWSGVADVSEEEEEGHAMQRAERRGEEGGTEGGRRTRKERARAHIRARVRALLRLPFRDEEALASVGADGFRRLVLQARNADA